VRPLLALLCAVIAACGAASDRATSATAPLECVVDADCVAAGATCCECPTYAAPAADVGAACGQVACPRDPMCPANVRARCEPAAHRCVLACAPMACPTACPTGYATDAAGCLSCECAPAASGCVADTDCVEVPADCCGCAGGGADTAVAAADVAAHRAALGCPPAPACPGVDVCDLAATPRCARGACTLAALPPAACGRPDLPACPAGQACTINASPGADELGLGVCQ
jgi:hypothetical protein